MIKNVLKELYSGNRIRLFVDNRLIIRKAMLSSDSLKNKIGILQITCGASKQENFEVCKSLITQAKDQGAKMVFLPEACDYIESTVQASLEKAESLDGEFISQFRKLAADLDIWISIGSFHRKVQSASDSQTPVKNFNTQVILDNKGEIKSVYDKLHLFEINLKSGDSVTNLKESDYTQPGGRFNLPLETPVGVLGTSICYDLRFPQMSTIQRKLGAQILTYPSVFTVPTGKAHWEVLLRARAIENQCYVIASAQVGKHNEKRSSYGHSLVIDPWGKVLADCGEQSPDLKVVEIDLAYLNEVRDSMPILNSIRNDLYSGQSFIRKNIDQETYQFGSNIKLPNECVFFESNYSIAFVNLRPIVPGHVVIIPKQIRLRVEDLSNEEALDLFHVSKMIAAKLEKHYQGTSLNFGIQDGPESGQSVQHVHMHIIPRRKGDFKKDEIYDKMRDHDKEGSGIRARTNEEMAEEARVLRRLFGYDS